ncbi:MAG: glucose-6-phosphate isomerase, partial [Patescibacteria group bacterium]
YANHNLPFRHIELSELNAFELGKFMQTQMNEVIALAKLMGVDAFNQPAVEEYKKEARRLLSSS